MPRLPASLLACGMAGIRLVSRRDGNPNGRIKGYRLEASDGSDAWNGVAEGELPASSKTGEIRFEKPVEAAALRLTVLSTHSPGPWASLAELELIPVKEAKP